MPKKRKSFGKMKAAKDRGGDFYDQDRKDNKLSQRPHRGTGQSFEVCGDFVLEVALAPITLWRERAPMASVGFLQSLWEKPIWEGVWPYLDPMDSVSLRTASVEWNVPGRYGPHSELFFFLIEKEPARTGNETFSSFLNANIRTLPLLLLSSKKCARPALNRGRKRRSWQRCGIAVLLECLSLWTGCDS